jgi:hypothetical protein
VDASESDAWAARMAQIKVDAEEEAEAEAQARAWIVHAL